jgi:hypothetical protein
MALTRTLGANSTALDRVIEATAPLGGGITIAPWYAHQGDVRSMLITEPPPDRRIAGMPKRPPRKIQLDDAPELLQRRLCPPLPRAVEPPALLCSTCSAPYCRTVCGNIAPDGDHLATGLGDLLSGLGVQFRDDDLGSLPSEQLGGRASDAGSGARNDGYFSVKPWHVWSPRFTVGHRPPGADGDQGAH